MSKEDLKKLTVSNENLSRVHTFGRSLGLFQNDTEKKFNSLTRQIRYNPNKVSPSGKGLGGCKLLNRTKPIPKTWDWRKFGVVTSVRQQLTCGACW